MTSGNGNLQENVGFPPADAIWPTAETWRFRSVFTSVPAMVCPREPPAIFPPTRASAFHRAPFECGRLRPRSGKPLPDRQFVFGIHEGFTHTPGGWMTWSRIALFLVDAADQRLVKEQLSPPPRTRGDAPPNYRVGEEGSFRPASATFGGGQRSFCGRPPRES